MKCLLKCIGLSKNYGKKTALDNVSLELKRGRIVGLVGPNGSGKTTLIKIAAGLLTKTSGEIFVCDEPIGVNTKKLISYLPDRNYLPDWMKTRDLVRIFEDFYPDFDCVKAMEMLGRLGIVMNMNIKAMSKGTREKMQLVLAMSRKAELYLLDEPIGGVDPAARDYILETIVGNYNENGTVLLSTHLISDVEKILDDVIMLSDGKILMQGTADELREQNGKSVDEIFREVFRC